MNKLLLTAIVITTLTACGPSVDTSGVNNDDVELIYNEVPYGVSVITMPSRRGKGSVKCYIAVAVEAVALDCGDYNE